MAEIRKELGLVGTISNIRLVGMVVTMISRRVPPKIGTRLKIGCRRIIMNV